MSTEANKAIVARFNREVIEQGSAASFEALVSPAFVNYTAPTGTDSGPHGLLTTFVKVLRPAFPNLKVVIHDQIAEGDKVTTRKTIVGTHRGELMGIPATGRSVTIEVIDIVRIQHGRYIEHWGINTLAQVLNQLRAT